MNVVLVDDEIRICQLIKALIDWDSLGMKVVGEANNGIDALELIKTCNPDIVITDIRMPGYDGITLIKKAKESGIRASFIITSGYRDFEYAHDALKCGVEDYILKPINKEELTSILQKLADRNMEGRQLVEYQSEMKNRLETSNYKLRYQFVESVLHNRPGSNNYYAAGIEKECPLVSSSELIQFVGIKISRLNRADETAIDTIVINKVTSLVRALFQNKCSQTELYSYEDFTVCFLNYMENQEEKVRSEIKKLHDNIKTVISEYGMFMTAVGVGCAVNQIKDCPSAIHSAIRALQFRLIIGSDKTIDANAYHFTDASAEDIITPERRVALQHSMESFDFGNVEKNINDVFAAAKSMNQVNACVFGEICAKIIDILNNEIKVDADHAKAEEDLRSLKNAVSVEELTSRLNRFIRRRMESAIESKQFQNNKPVRAAKQYVQDHYKEPITLEDIAGIVHLNPVYFSVIFKKETSQNFSDYLINYRLEVAKNLLRTTFLRISEISEAVGYKDAKYFSKLFNKVIGLKPNEYRRLYS